MSNFPHILDQILSTDRQAREAGEVALNSLIQQAPDQVAQYLAAAMGSGNDNVSTLAAVLFRRKLLEEGVIKGISPDVKMAIRTALLQAPSSSSSPHHLRLLADVLVNFADADEWGPDLMRHMGGWIQDQNPMIKEFTLYLFELATDTHMDEILRRNASAVATLLTDKLTDTDLNIQLSAVKTTCSFLAILESTREALAFSSLGPMLLSAITRALQEEPLRVLKMKEALINLADLTENHPRFWRGCADEFCRVMTTLAKSAFFPKELRGAATEVLSTFIPKAANIIQKSVFFTQELIVLSLTLMADLPPVTLEDWILDEENTDVVSNEPHSLGKDLLSRLATFLGPETVLTHFQQLIPLHLRSEDWVKQHTGILAVGMIAEGCHSSFERNLADILNMILPFFSSSNQRLVWAATTTMGLLCSEFEPKLEYELHQMVVPVLIRNFNHECIKVQTQTVNALINFIRGLLVDDEDTTAQYILPYAPSIMDGLLSLLQIGLERGYYPLLSKVLDAVSATSSVLTSAFATYYNTFIPGLRTLIGLPASNPQQQEVRAECIKAMGYMIASVADAGQPFIEDANAILVSLIQQRATMGENDPGVLALEGMAHHFAEALKERFAPFLPTIVPGLLDHAGAQVSIAFLDANSPEAALISQSLEAVNIEMRGHGTKQIAMDSSAMERKIEACKNVYQLVHALKQVYSPMVVPTVSTLLPMMDWSMSAAVRKYCVKTVGACIEAADTQEMKEGLLRQVFPTFKSILEKTIEALISDTKHLLKSLMKAVEAVQSTAVVGLPAAIEMCNVLSTALSHVFRRKMMRDMLKKQNEGEGLSDDDRDEIEEDERIDDEILRLIMELVGAMLKSFRSDFQPIFKQLFQSYYEALFAKPNPSDVEILSAVCVFDDYVLHTKDVHMIGNRLPLLEKMLPYCGHSDSSVRQSSIYGVGLFAELTPTAVFSAYTQSAIEACTRIICAADSRSDSNIEATECAVGALGKIALLHYPDCLDFWLTCLPLRSEPEEARSINKLFLLQYPRLRGFGDKASRVLADLRELTKMKPDLLDAEGADLLLRETSGY